MKSLIIIVGILLLAPARAFAGASRTFQGWSKDGTFWALTTEGLGDDDEVVFCPSHKGVPPTWPAGLPKERDDKGCASMTLLAYQAAKLPALATVIEPATSAKRGPGGLTLTLKKVRRHGQRERELWLSRGKLKLKADINGVEEPNTVDDIYWRADGLAVAIAISVISSKDEFQESTVDVVDLSSLAKAPAAAVKKARK